MISSPLPLIHELGFQIGIRILHTFFVQLFASNFKRFAPFPSLHIQPDCRIKIKRMETVIHSDTKTSRHNRFRVHIRKRF